MDNKYFIKYLRLINVILDKEELIYQLETHPEYPSLLSYHDVLNFFNVDNVAVNIESKETNDLPDQFLAEISPKNRSPQLALVEKKGFDFEVFLEEDKKTTLSEAKFKKLWTGVVLAAEASNQKKSNRKKSKFTVVALGIILLAFIGFFSLISAVSSVLIIVGLFLSSESIKQEFNVETGFSNKFCKGIQNTDCNSVINSKALKLLENFGLSDISIVFFTGQLVGVLVYLLLNSEIVYYQTMFYILILTIPVSLFSIFYQWKIVKKWCPLCLSIIALLFLQIGLHVFYLEGFESIKSYFLNSMSIVFLPLFIILLLVWTSFKPYVKDYYNLKSENKELFRFKRNYELFKYSLRKEKKEQIYFPSDIYIGNEKAKFRLKIVTNPSCKYCRDTHFLLEKILETHKGSVRIDISFYHKIEKETISNIDRLHLKLIDVYFEKGQNFFLEALGDWFSHKNHKKWFHKYGENLLKVENDKILLNQQYDKNVESGVQFTPSLFIKNYSYPNIYEKKDLLLYIDDLLEDDDFLT